MKTVVEKLNACHIEYCDNLPVGYGPPVNPDGPEAAALIDELVEALERAAENFERLTVPHIVGHDVHNFAFQAAKIARTALAKAHHPEEVLK
jgi:hypothetical protein